MANQQLKDNKLPVREWLRKNYIQPETKYMAICRHCSSVISYKQKSIHLLYHLRIKHSEILTREQRDNENVQWIWDYFTPQLNKKAKCNICGKMMCFVRSSYFTNLTYHLNIHRDT